MKRLIATAAAALLVTACAANQKKLDPSDTVIDGAASNASAPVTTEPVASTPPPGTCASDDQCGTGERCQANRCVAAPSCDLVRVQFPFNSSQLDEGARSSLRADADCLAKKRPAALLIEGHCDERGTVQYNIALGARRADAVRKYLADLGVKTKFDTVSFGKELPVAQGSSESAWAQNRRAEMRMPGDRRSDGQMFAGR
jgi:peptidoglycan-associated lipoprotein